MAYAACPPVLKTADFPRIAPYYLIIPVAEKRRIKVDKVYALGFHRLEDFKVIAQYQSVYGHVLIMPFWGAIGNRVLMPAVAP